MHIVYALKMIPARRFRFVYNCTQLKLRKYQILIAARCTKLFLGRVKNTEKQFRLSSLFVTDKRKCGVCWWANASRDAFVVIPPGIYREIKRR
jgi:hypothetical protein